MQGVSWIRPLNEKEGVTPRQKRRRDSMSDGCVAFVGHGREGRVVVFILLLLTWINRHQTSWFG